MAKEKEFDAWSQRNDHANGVELMVHITLAEYRELVDYKAKSESKVSEMRAKQTESDKKLEEAKKKIEELNSKLVCLLQAKEGVE